MKKMPLYIENESNMYYIYKIILKNSILFGKSVYLYVLF